MKVKCPWCGAKGTDVRPPAEGLTGPSGEPIHLKGQEEYAFEVRGNYAGRPVRKCLNCGNGVRITFLPPRFNKVSPEEWTYLQEQWVAYKAQQDEYFDRLDAMREQDAALSIPADVEESIAEDADAHERRQTIAKGMRLAAKHRVDLPDLANFIIEQFAAVRPPDTEEGTRWAFPEEAVRAMCALDFVNASRLDDPRLDEAFARDAIASDEETRANLGQVAEQVLDERGLTPVVDALVILLSTDDWESAL
jgi:hypothetical protein